MNTNKVYTTIVASGDTFNKCFNHKQIESVLVFPENVTINFVKSIVSNGTVRNAATRVSNMVDYQKIKLYKVVCHYSQQGMIEAGRERQPLYEIMDRDDYEIVLIDNFPCLRTARL
eukprot:gene18157-21715_t